MIVKGTKQLRNIRRGVNLYTPTQTGIIKIGLSLYLDANNARSYGGSGNTWYDLTVPNDNITLVGSPTFTSSNPKHFSFNGSNQYGTGTGNVLPQSGYTKCVWFKLNNIAADNNLISSDIGGHFMYLKGTNKLYCGHSNWLGGYDVYPSTANFNTGIWYFAALTFNTTDGMKLYVNGVLDSTYTVVKTAHGGDGSTNIGCFGANGNLLNGSISIAMAYNRAIDATEVLRNYEMTKSNFGY